MLFSITLWMLECWMQQSQKQQGLSTRANITTDSTLISTLSIKIVGTADDYKMSCGS
jgi:hypothetical protein